MSSSVFAFPRGVDLPLAQGSLRLLCLAVAFWLAAWAQAGESRLPPPQLALDHISVAVHDLAEARRAFERMGFTIKPGRVHANSIDNLHIKFMDGTEIELITAARPLDALAAEYLSLVSRGDGGAFICLQTPDVSRLLDALRGAGRAHRLTTGQGFRSVTLQNGPETFPTWFIEMPRLLAARPEVTTHSNGALGIVSLWYSTSAYSGAEEVLSMADARLRGPVRGEHLPLRLKNAEIVPVDVSPGPNGRPLVGVIVCARSLTIVQDSLAAAKLRHHVVKTEGGTHVVVDRAATGSITIGFTE